MDADMNKPILVDVALVTWPNHPSRLEYFKRTVEALRANLTASRHELVWLCSAESERDPKYPWCGDALAAFCESEGIRLLYRPEGASASTGANHNAAMRAGTGDVVLLQQDDWLLTEPLDISDGVDLLLDDSTVDIVRYSFPNNDRQRPTFYPWRDGWRKLDLAGRWPYGDDPHLRRRDFMDKWGWYKEGKHGQQSSDLMGRLIAGNATIVASRKSYFVHYGKVTAVVDDVRWPTKTR